MDTVGKPLPHADKLGWIAERTTGRPKAWVDADSASCFWGSATSPRCNLIQNDYKYSVSTTIIHELKKQAQPKRKPEPQPQDNPFPSPTIMSSCPGFKSNISITWIGTATTIIDVDEVRPLTNPFFHPAESSVDTGRTHLQVHHDSALQLKDLAPIDAVLLSHEDY